MQNTQNTNGKNTYHQIKTLSREFSFAKGLQTRCKKPKVLITEPKTNLTVPSLLTLLKSKTLTLKH